MGAGYLTDALIAAVNARRRETVYRVYVTDALYALCAFAGVPLRARFRDVIAGSDPRVTDGMATAVSRLENMGIKVVNGWSYSRWRP